MELRASGAGPCFVVRYGVGKERVADTDSATVTTFLSSVAAWVGAEFRASSPRLHAADPRLGMRIQAAMPPVAPYPFMICRKHPRTVFPLSDFVDKQILTPRQAQLLEEAVASRQTIVISGSVGSAKTSLLNALVHTLNTSGERIVILEDDPELVCDAPDVAFLHTSLDPLVTLRDLGKDLLRLSPDRIVIGEVRDGALLDALKAFQTGHPGLLSIHAESAAQTLKRMEQLNLEVSTTPQQQLIGDAIDVICHMQKWGQGWKCTQLLRLTEFKRGSYQTQHML